MLVPMVVGNLDLIESKRFEGNFAYLSHVRRSVSASQPCILAVYPNNVTKNDQQAADILPLDPMLPITFDGQPTHRRWDGGTGQPPSILPLVATLVNVGASVSDSASPTSWMYEASRASLPPVHRRILFP